MNKRKKNNIIKREFEYIALENRKIMYSFILKESTYINVLCFIFSRKH